MGNLRILEEERDDFSGSKESEVDATISGVLDLKSGTRIKELRIELITRLDVKQGLNYR